MKIKITCPMSMLIMWLLLAFSFGVVAGTQIGHIAGPEQVAIAVGHSAPGF